MIHSLTNKRQAAKKTKACQTLYDFTPSVEQWGNRAFLVSPVDGSLTIGLALHLLPVEVLENAEHEGFHQLLNKALTELPIGAMLQKHDVFFSGEFNAPSTEEGFFLASQVESYLGTPLTYHKSYVYLTFPSQKQTNQKVKAGTPLGGIFRHSLLARFGLANTYKNINETFVTKSFEYAEKFLVTLESFGQLSFDYLNAQALQRNLAEFGNLSFYTQESSHYPTRYQRELGVKSEVTFLGEKKLQMLSLVEQGQSVSSVLKDGNGLPVSMVKPLGFGISAPHVVIQTFRVADTEAELKRLDRDKKLRALTPARDEDAATEHANLTQFTLEMRQSQGKLVLTGLQVLLWELNTNDLIATTNNALDTFGRLSPDMGIWVEKEQDTRHLFLASFPGMGLNNYRQFLAPSHEAMCYVLKETNHAYGRGELLFLDRMNNPVRFNLWRSGIKGQSGIVIGPTGAGKSFIMQQIISCQHERLLDDAQGDRHYIIDVGGSYFGVVGQLGGHYFETGSKSHQLKFNPFRCAKDEAGHYIFTSEADGETNKLVTLLTLLRTIYKGHEPLSPTETAALKNFIVFYYVAMSHQSDIPLGMNSFYEFLVEYFEGKGVVSFAVNHPELIRLADRMQKYYQSYLITDKYFDFPAFLMVLEDFVGEGSYASYLNADESIDISGSRITAFDLEGVKNDERLYPIVAILIIEQILETFRRYPTARKHLVIDEAWTMFSGPMKEFIEYMVRTCRKKQGALIIVTQGIQEIDESDIGATLVANSSKLLLLDHAGKEESVARLQEVLKLTDGQVAMLMSIKKYPDMRDLMVVIEGKAQMLRFKPSFEQVVAYSSEASDMHARRALADKFGGDMDMVIQQMKEDAQVAAYEQQQQRQADFNQPSSKPPTS